MSNLRFTLFAFAAFIAAFVGISWASKGFPVMTLRATPLQPDARIPTFEESTKAGLRKDWQNSKTSQGDGDKERNALRLAALQAANAYSLSPCDKTIKKNLVEALTAYVRAWTNKAGCNFIMCGGGAKVEAAAADFSSPADMRVREAVGAAFEQGGISIEDFPYSIRLFVAMVANDRGDPRSACATGPRADGKPMSFQEVKRALRDSRR